MLLLKQDSNSGCLQLQRLLLIHLLFIPIYHQTALAYALYNGFCWIAFIQAFDFLLQNEKPSETRINQLTPLPPPSTDFPSFSFDDNPTAYYFNAFQNRVQRTQE